MITYCNKKLEAYCLDNENYIPTPKALHVHLSSLPQKSSIPLFFQKKRKEEATALQHTTNNTLALLVDEAANYNGDCCVTFEHDEFVAQWTVSSLSSSCVIT